MSTTTDPTHLEPQATDAAEPYSPAVDDDPSETREWLDAIEGLRVSRGPDRVRRILRELQIHAQRSGVVLPVTSETPYTNTIPPDREPPYPGDRGLEQRLKSLMRWNAMAMVVRANREESGIGGHISTFASAASLYQVGFHHFFRGKSHPCGGDFVYIQGHASPGIYARAFLEGRISEAHLARFRRELSPGGGLSSYPHPWCMPDFWEFPTVSMGLGPLLAIYRARFLRYLEDRGLTPKRGAKVWAFLGDGECDEPEALGAIGLATRERLDNLIFVVNCNLQRLDGPVRGNGKIIQELEAIFRGSGWNVLKVLWGSDWDPLFARDTDGLLVRRLGELVDGQYQQGFVEGGAKVRELAFSGDPRLEALAEGLSDDRLWKLRLGGHDPEKLHAAYHAAFHHVGAPTVILAKTIKGYGLGEAGEGKNITHQQKKLNEQELLKFRDRFNIPISPRDVGKMPFYRPPEGSPELIYLHERRKALGGYLPSRVTVPAAIPAPPDAVFAEYLQGTGDREASTTMAFVQLLGKLLRDKTLGPRIVPIVPDEARTFGMESLFRQCGIYSSVGQNYDPVDRKSLLYYREAKDGQILEEGITEAGSMSSFVAAGTAHAHHGLAMVPVFLFYSMFGLQRIGDLAWAAGDSRCRGFLIGATSGRTTLAGEGLQHQDGHSHLLAYPLPNLVAYDPAYAYEIATIVQDGLRRMYERDEDVFYYLTVGNEAYAQPAMPEGSREGILRGIYRFRPVPEGKTAAVSLFGSGAILNEVVNAQSLLAENFGVDSEVWSVTSYKELRRDALDAERESLLRRDAAPRVPCLVTALGPQRRLFVAASDYVKALPDSIAKWLPGPLVSLGTDGFGRSDGRAALRDYFEVDAKFVAFAALHGLAREGKFPADRVAEAARTLGIDTAKANPMRTG